MIHTLPPPNQQTNRCFLCGELSDAHDLGNGFTACPANAESSNIGRASPAPTSSTAEVEAILLRGGSEASLTPERYPAGAGIAAQRTANAFASASSRFGSPTNRSRASSVPAEPVLYEDLPVEPMDVHVLPRENALDKANRIEHWRTYRVRSSFSKATHLSPLRQNAHRGTTTARYSGLGHSLKITNAMDNMDMLSPSNVRAAHQRTVRMSRFPSSKPRKSRHRSWENGVNKALRRLSGRRYDRHPTPPPMLYAYDIDDDMPHWTEREGPKILTFQELQDERPDLYKDPLVEYLSEQEGAEADTTLEGTTLEGTIQEHEQPDASVARPLKSILKVRGTGDTPPPADDDDDDSMTYIAPARATRAQQEAARRDLRMGMAVKQRKELEMLAAWHRMIYERIPIVNPEPEDSYSEAPLTPPPACVDDTMARCFDPVKAAAPPPSVTSNSVADDQTTRLATHRPWQYVKETLDNAQQPLFAYYHTYAQNIARAKEEITAAGLKSGLVQPNSNAETWWIVIGRDDEGLKEFALAHEQSTRSEVGNFHMQMGPLRWGASVQEIEEVLRKADVGKDLPPQLPVQIMPPGVVPWGMLICCLLFAWASLFFSRALWTCS
ncbi:hypothetical protein FA95DRAFT_474647 [Auriscalpium vulgare]|uniref:Uncharacterized protein n=1 Tax=Auriscalpium vulgare TaxID=40419 RepID=A0ACB8SBQ0_9AGAM|nr:hypothetical protein FA95DRAFT_474647 [Auriscalpium vulgare]